MLSTYGEFGCEDKALYALYLLANAAINAGGVSGGNPVFEDGNMRDGVKEVLMSIGSGTALRRSIEGLVVSGVESSCGCRVGVCAGNVESRQGSVGCDGNEQTSSTGDRASGDGPTTGAGDRAESERATGLGDASRGCLPGETTKARNQRWKAEKKQRKERRNLNRMSAEIRKGPKAVERMVVERKGYFSACPDDVQQELVNTRAALLIAQNKKELAIAERKQRMLTSNVTLVRDVLNVVKMQEQVEKVTKRRNDVRVGGWAQTVLSASSSEMVDKAASKPDSSIPTMASIPIGDCVDSSQREKRELQYKLALAELEANIGEIGLQYEEEIEQAKAKIKEEFSDVAYSDELRFKREFIADMARDMTLNERARLFTLAEAQGIDLDGLQY